MEDSVDRVLNFALRRGYSVEHTGGGCLCLQNTVPVHWQSLRYIEIRITDGDATIPHQIEDPVVVVWSFLDHRGDWVPGVGDQDFVELESLEEAFKWVRTRVSVILSAANKLPPNNLALRPESLNAMFKHAMERLPEVGDTIEVVYPSAGWGKAPVKVVKVKDDPDLKPLEVQSASGTVGFFRYEQVKVVGDD
jgi:hypothetical protein